MTISQKLEQAVAKWVEKQDEKTETAVHEILDSPEYAAMGYLDRNSSFLTSSKLKAYQECAYHAFLKYVKRVEMGFDEADHFTIGSALDLRLTSGEQAYQDRYAVVARRTEKTAEENEGKTLLTNSQAQVIENAAKEYRSREFFPAVPKKKNVLFILHGMAAKAELDHFDEQAARIEDTKTTSSILTFRPTDYSLQLGFYSYAVEKRYGLQCNGALNVIDKSSNFSRSHKWIFTRPTLMSYHHQVEELARQWRDSVETSIWPHTDTSTDEGKRTCWQSEFWSCCQFCRQMEPTTI